MADKTVSSKAGNGPAFEPASAAFSPPVKKTGDDPIASGGATGSPEAAAAIAARSAIVSGPIKLRSGAA